MQSLWRRLFGNSSNRVGVIPQPTFPVDNRVLFERYLDRPESTDPTVPQYVHRQRIAIPKFSRQPLPPEWSVNQTPSQPAIPKRGKVYLASAEPSTGTAENMSTEAVRKVASTNRLASQELTGIIPEPSTGTAEGTDINSVKPHAIRIQRIFKKVSGRLIGQDNFEVVFYNQEGERIKYAYDLETGQFVNYKDLETMRGVLSDRFGIPQSQIKVEWRRPKDERAGVTEAARIDEDIDADSVKVSKIKIKAIFRNISNHITKQGFEVIFYDQQGKKIGLNYDLTSHRFFGKPNHSVVALRCNDPSDVSKILSNRFGIPLDEIEIDRSRPSREERVTTVEYTAGAISSCPEAENGIIKSATAKITRVPLGNGQTSIFRVTLYDEKGHKIRRQYDFKTRTFGVDDNTINASFSCFDLETAEDRLFDYFNIGKDRTQYEVQQTRIDTPAQESNASGIYEVVGESDNEVVYREAEPVNLSNMVQLTQESDDIYESIAEPSFASVSAECIDELPPLQQTSSTHRSLSSQQLPQVYDSLADLSTQKTGMSSRLYTQGPGNISLKNISERPVQKLAHDDERQKRILAAVNKFSRHASSYAPSLFTTF